MSGQGGNDEGFNISRSQRKRRAKKRADKRTVKSPVGSGVQYEKQYNTGPTHMSARYAAQAAELPPFNAKDQEQRRSKGTVTFAIPTASRDRRNDLNTTGRGQEHLGAHSSVSTQTQQALHQAEVQVSRWTEDQTLQLRYQLIAILRTDLEKAFSAFLMIPHMEAGANFAGNCKVDALDMLRETEDMYRRAGKKTKEANNPDSNAELSRDTGDAVQADYRDEAPAAKDSGKQNAEDSAPSIVEQLRRISSQMMDMRKETHELRREVRDTKARRTTQDEVELGLFARGRDGAQPPRMDKSTPQSRLHQPWNPRDPQDPVGTAVPAGRQQTRGADNLPPQQLNAAADHFVPRHSTATTVIPGSGSSKRTCETPRTSSQRRGSSPKKLGSRPATRERPRITSTAEGHSRGLGDSDDHHDTDTEGHSQGLSDSDDSQSEEGNPKEKGDLDVLVEEAHVPHEATADAMSADASAAEATSADAAAPVTEGLSADLKEAPASDHSGKEEDSTSASDNGSTQEQLRSSDKDQWSSSDIYGELILDIQSREVITKERD
ncbi:unnamed protein product [Sphagnum tenellum]